MNSLIILSNFTQYVGEQQFSFTKMQVQLQDAGNTTTLANYLQLLNSAGLLGGLQKYSGAAIQTKNSLPKLQVYNNALISAWMAMDLHLIKTNLTNGEDGLKILLAPI